MGEQIRLPRTATRRGGLCFAKLLESVDPKAKDGFGFKGRILEPGARIDENELGANPVVLECTEIEGSHAIRKRKKWERLYILWRWDAERREWAEIARIQSQGSDWAVLLREAARFALGKISWAIVPRVADVVERIRLVVDRELANLEREQRSEVLAELHDELAAKRVESDAA